MNWINRLLRRPVSGVFSVEQQLRYEAWEKLQDYDAEAAHLKVRYVVVDVEASGLNLNKDRLISIGAVAVNGGAIDMNDAFEVVLRQEQVSDSSNILIHGIGASAQREGVEPVEALLQFLEYIGKSPLMAYHSFFDQGMIDAAGKRYLGFAPSLVWHDLAWILPDLFPDRISGVVGLDAWLEQFKIENYQRHNAVSDCLATAQLLQIVMGMASSRGIESPADLMKVERARRRLRRS